MINNYTDFKAKLYEVGFTTGGTNDEGIFSISSFYNANIKWHTDNIDTDPWEFRMRILEDREDIAYAKLFFNKSGYITKEWYPYFLRIRRANSLQDEYLDGNISAIAKQIFEVIKANKEAPLHAIKQECGITKTNKSKFDRAITELQMKMYITMCGRARKISLDGKPYGWSSTMFCIPENYFESSVFEIANNLEYETAFDKIKNQIFKLNPDAQQKRIKKFIIG